MAKILKTTFKFRRGYAETFVKNNTLLQQGEPAFEIDTFKLKIGDGITRWNDLPYVIDIDTVIETVIEKLPTISKDKIKTLFITTEEKE